LNSGVLVSIADWTWNKSSYNPKAVIIEAVKKLRGPDAYSEMVKVNKLLSFFDEYYSDPVNPNAIKNAAEIIETYKQLEEELIALDEATISDKPDYWMGLYALAVIKDFARKKLPAALKDPSVSKYIEYAEATMEVAKKESALNCETDIFRSAMEFSGGAGPKFYEYKQVKKGIDVKRRFSTWIYGAESIKPSMSTKFEVIPFPPSGDYKLIVSGLDDDSKEKCPIRITLNESLIFEGSNPFSEKDWNIHEFDIPGDRLKRNNILTIENIASSDSISGPPFFMLNYAILRDTTK
jgi:hypothetical protein